MSCADYQRQWRAKQGAKTGQPGRPITATCGTVAAYKRHQRKSEEVDTACRDAWAAYQREMYQRRKNTAPNRSRPSQGHTAGNQGQSERVLDSDGPEAYLVTPMGNKRNNSNISRPHTTTPGGVA